MKIALDIGHATGTGSASNGVDEHEYCAAMASNLAAQLKDRHNVKIFDFPHLSNSADLAATVKNINAGEFDLVISLHCDFSGNPGARGAHVCYYSQTGKKYAESIARHLCQIMPGRAEKIVRRPGLYVLNSTDAPAVLIEFGFVSNAGDVQKMRTNAQDLARAVVNGIDAAEV